MKFMQKYPRYHTMNKKVKFLGKGQNSMLKHRKPQKSILSGEFVTHTGEQAIGGLFFESP